MGAQQRVSRRQWVMAGAVGGFASALLMTGLMFVGRFTLGTPLIPELMAEQLFALIPLDLFSLGIRLFGLKAKYLAFWGMVGLFVLIGLFLGVVFTWLTKRHWLKAHWRGGLAYGSLLLALFGLVGSPLLGAGLFGANLEGGLLLSSSSLLLLYWVYGTTLGLLSSRLLRRPRNTLTTTGSSLPPLDASRRAFATRLLTGILAAGSFSALLQLLDTLTTRSRAFAQDLFQRLKGLPPELTPNEKFYKISKNVFDPKVNVSRWSLKLKGLVERPMQLTYSELKALPMKEQYGTLECISNEVGGDLVSNARWKGIPLGELLARAGVKSSAKKVVF
ncbi:MAG: molybdopterin-dependent oxidoreductase, partial [candidate division NC10 bacterium]|nr:molybdopterin-dependent oxidoreductase [candidate division NC10 bacterium]